ncbi:biotin carboxyl carrier domain-containing protein [Nocardioides albidus]|uniref:Biotin carboxyl carrier protein of acetyl-CoA carboxylase n=1 Tax=Nocardioides albidus TaxID=1517589 RepID=A0A5C4VS15_9ACTN|nr:acetyl-CoA carboxylase [Nocardioides albidus]TNM38653.1 biotin carboxyl carrier domain-containing protein [Nocardioides albidus]
MSEHAVTSPLPGVFYRCPSPGEPPFVEDGAAVESGQVIGLVEIMKQFTEIRADAAGVLSFEVDDLGMVEPGATIAVVKEG